MTVLAEGALASVPLQRVVLPGGVELHVAIDGRGPPLVFVHGAMGDWRSWAPQWPAFTARFRCASYSRRYSHPNRNEMPSPDHSALLEAEDLRGMLDALGWREAVVVGSSYGGFTGLALAVAHPARVRALVAVEPPMMRYAQATPEGRAASAAFRRDVIEPANAAFRAGDDVRAARIMTGGINGAASPLVDDAAMARRLQNVRAMRMLALSSDEFPLLEPERLAALPMPVLLLAGERTEPIHDAILHAVGASMPQARVARVPDAGHACARDNPAAFDRLVLDFLHDVLR